MTISEKLIKAILGGKAKSIGGNTFVDFIPCYGNGITSNQVCCEVVLYNTTIARLFIDIESKTINSYEFNHGGFKTNTTKDRMNAIADHFGLPRVYQHNFVWYQDIDGIKTEF